MRVRHKPHARAELEAWPCFCAQPALQKGNWSAFFKSPERPFYIELGCGKGRFIAQHAVENPGINFLGIDIKDEMLLTAKHTAENIFNNSQKMPDNLALTAFNIEKILDILSINDCVARIYINFCNPWYKSGHAKHRLTHPRQLIQYRTLLLPDGMIYFKTDDMPLYQDSLRYFGMTGFQVDWQTEDLHQGEPVWNIRTEHEAMFAEQGLPIKACIAKMVPAELDIPHISRMKDV